MTSDKLRECVEGIISDKASKLQVYLILEDDKRYELRLADIEEQEAISDLKRMFKRSLRDLIVNNQELEVRRLSEDDEMEGAVYLYDYDVYPEELDLIKQFTISDGVETDKFNFGKDDLKSKRQIVRLHRN